MFIKLVKDYFGQKAGCQVAVDEVVGKALVEQKVGEAVANDPLAPLMQKSMEGMLANLTNCLNQTIDATLKQFADAQTKSKKNGVPAIFGQGGDGDPKKTFGNFLIALRGKDTKSLEDMGSRFVEWDGVEKKTTMTTQTGTTGGYLVPTQFYAKLMALVTEMSIVRSRATIIPMTSRVTQIPALDVTTPQAAGDTAFLGGVVARWTEEATTSNKTEPNLKQIDLTNYELSGYSQVGNTLLADSAIGLEAFLFTIFSRAIAWYEDYAFIRGNGAAKPLGFQSWQGFIQVARKTASHFNLADVANMYARLLPGGGSPHNLAWVIHPTVLADFLQMASTAAAGQNIVLNNIQGKPQLQMLGIDVCVSEKVAALGSANDVSLFDGSQYLLGDRQQVEIAFSEHVAFLNNQSVWRFVSRVGGQPWLRDKVTLADATTTLSPFVGLAA